VRATLPEGRRSDHPGAKTTLRNAVEGSLP
jgi:hypothetical protein